MPRMHATLLIWLDIIAWLTKQNDLQKKYILYDLYVKSIPHKQYQKILSKKFRYMNIYYFKINKLYIYEYILF